MKTYRNPFSHVDLRVPGFEKAPLFYQKLLSALEFTHIFDTPASTPKEDTSDFWEDSPAEAERIARLIGEAGKINTGPQFFPVSPSHYAVFSEDLYGHDFGCMRRVQ